MISLDPRSTSSAQDNTGKASAPIAQNDSQLNSDPTDQSATNRKIGKDSASLQKVPRRVTVATWVVRLCFAFVLPVSLLFALLPRVVLGAYTGNAELIAAAVPSLWVMLTTIVPCVPAFIYQFSVSGTGNTRTALGITLVCVTAYTLYTLWLVYVVRADVALCWTADHVYYLISLALSYAYIRSGRWRRLKI